MNAPKEKIEIYRNGKAVKTFYLNRGYQRKALYFEHEDIAAELAQGKPKDKAKAEALTRAATEYFNEAISCLNEAGRLDSQTGAALLYGMYETLSSGVERSAGGGASMAALEDRAAALFFAWRDACYSIMQRDADEERLFTAVCFDVDGSGSTKARAKEARETMKALKEEEEREAQRELSPRGRAIFDSLEAANRALEECIEQGGPDEDERADRIMEEAQAPLDALALEDPEEATRIFTRSTFFDEGIEKYEIYLGHDTFCNRIDLKRLDTPQKRAAYINSGLDNMDDFITIDSGEPVKLEGFPPEEIRLQ